MFIFLWKVRYHNVFLSCPCAIGAAGGGVVWCKVMTSLRVARLHPLAFLHKLVNLVNRSFWLTGSVSEKTVNDQARPACRLVVLLAVAYQN